MKNVYLIGMMGSGKTATGRELATFLKFQFVDLDDLIMERAGQSINDIFRTEGEPYFRRLESEILYEVAARTGQVAATGGGIVLNPQNGARMKETGMVIYLKTSLEVLWERVKAKKDRPLLTTQNPRKTLADLLRERSLSYEEIADKTFSTDQKSSEAVALEIYKACFES